jgi:hypothetical protein
MKKIFSVSTLIIIIFSLLIGCQQNTISTKTDHLSTNEDMKDFIEPEPSDWVKYSNIIRKYLYYRTQAVVNKDIKILWSQYPDLKDDVDTKKGINMEKYEMESLNGNFELLDANYDIESYERIKVKTIDDHNVVVLVHGSISYLRNDFDESGGEYLIKVFLGKTNNHWSVVKTDEYVLDEYKEWFENQK